LKRDVKEPINKILSIHDITTLQQQMRSSACKFTEALQIDGLRGFSVNTD